MVGKAQVRNIFIPILEAYLKRLHLNQIKVIRKKITRILIK